MVALAVSQPAIGDCGRRRGLGSVRGLVTETMRMAGLLHDVGHGPVRPLLRRRVLSAFDAPVDPRRPDAKRLTHEDLSGAIVGELGDLLRGLRRAPGPSRNGTRCVTMDRSTRVGSRSSSPSRRSATHRCRAGCAGWRHSCRASSRSTTSITFGATPTSRECRGAGRCRAITPIHVHRQRRADAVRTRARRARDVPELAALHVPAGLLPPDGARDRPRHGGGLRAVGRAIFGTAHRPVDSPPTPTSTSTRCCTRRALGSWAGRGSVARRRCGTR